MTLRFPRVSLLLLASAVLAAAPLLAQSNMPGDAPSSQDSKSVTQDGKGTANEKGSANQTFDPQAQVSNFGGKVVENIVARVNDQIITRSDYDRAAQQLQTDGRQQGWSEQEMAERKRDLLRDLVDQQLLLSKGKALGITGETELVKRLDEIRKQNHLETMEDLEKAASQQGVSYEDFKQAQRTGIITQEVIRNEVGRRIQLSHADVTRFYQEHQKEFSQPESVRLSEILIPVATGGDEAANLQAAQAKAADLSAKVKAGGNFEELAKANSSGSTAAQGGDLGEFKRGMLAKELEDRTFGLDMGQVTDPIRTKQGYIVLKVTQHTKGGTPDQKSIEPQVEEAAFMSRMQPALREYLTQLRKDAYLNTAPGYVDTAATPESVHPLYSAYTPPAPKKKAKMQRTRYRPSAHYRSKEKADAAGAAPANSVASAKGEEKPGKKVKVRYGQAPREALPAPAADAAQTTAANGAAAPGAPAATDAAANGTATENTAAAAAAATGATAPVPDAGGTEVARSVSSDIPNGEAAAEPEKKTRFSDRARLPKQKKAKTPDQIENANVGTATPEETAATQVQSAPLGLAGDTTHPKKEAKPKGEKTRYAVAERERREKESQPVAPQPARPSPLATPAAVPTQAAPTQSAPDDTTTPTQAAPADQQSTPPSGTASQPGSTQQ